MATGLFATTLAAIPAATVGSLAQCWASVACPASPLAPKCVNETWPTVSNPLRVFRCRRRAIPFVGLLRDSPVRCQSETPVLPSRHSDTRSSRRLCRRVQIRLHVCPIRTAVPQFTKTSRKRTLVSPAADQFREFWRSYARETSCQDFETAPQRISGTLTKASLANRLNVENEAVEENESYARFWNATCSFVRLMPGEDAKADRSSKATRTPRDVRRGSQHADSATTFDSSTYLYRGMGGFLLVMSRSGDHIVHCASSGDVRHICLESVAGRARRPGKSSCHANRGTERGKEGQRCMRLGYCI